MKCCVCSPCKLLKRLKKNVPVFLVNAVSTLLSQIHIDAGKRCVASCASHFSIQNWWLAAPSNVWHFYFWARTKRNDWRHRITFLEYIWQKHWKWFKCSKSVLMMFFLQNFSWEKSFFKLLWMKWLSYELNIWILPLSNQKKKNGTETSRNPNWQLEFRECGICFD